MTTSEWFRQFDEKLDKVHQVVVANGNRLTAHEVRICRLEKDDEQDDERRRHWARYLVGVFISLALLGCGAAITHVLGG